MIQEVDTSPAEVLTFNRGKLLVEVDTSAGTWTAGGNLLLPPSPSDGTRVLVKDSGAQAGTKSIVVDGNGNNIDDQLTREITNPFESLLLTYDGTQWAVI